MVYAGHAHDPGRSHPDHCGVADRACGTETTDRRTDRLVSAVHALSMRSVQVKAHPYQALGKRLLRHEDELFQFVLVAGLSADNNQAERSMRPLMIIRKISGSSRSDAGTKTRMGLASLFGTWLARGLNAFHE